ncbi:uncharacterized protein V2V93DRAFT_366962 [Kockiozyma suomiensis]|uniref:uncharacterized protein n=1 Tax=Kockiozyma suomiensis TaxID=1337062 RepID=UPI003343112D
MSLVPKVVYPVHPYPGYEPRDAIATTARLAVPCLTGSLAMTAAVERIRNPKGQLTDSMITMSRQTGYLTSVALVYQFVEVASANLREKEDGWNNFYGGLAGGAIAGLKKGTMTHTIWSALFVGSALGLARWAGGLFGSTFEETSIVPGSTYYAGEPEKGDFFAIRRRAPLSETISKLGEGRGLEYAKAGVSKPE